MEKAPSRSYTSKKIPSSIYIVNFHFTKIHLHLKMNIRKNKPPQVGVSLLVEVSEMKPGRLSGERNDKGPF